MRPVFTTAKRNLYAPTLFAISHNKGKSTLKVYGVQNPSRRFAIFEGRSR
jgi:hypothetical protein